MSSRPAETIIALARSIWTAVSVLSRVASAWRTAQPSDSARSSASSSQSMTTMFEAACAARDQLVDRLGAAGAEAGDDDVVAQGALQSGHLPFVPCPAENESVGGADEDQHEEDADRSHHQSVEHAGVVGHRDDVAIAGGGDADHREIDDVEEADLAVIIVPAGRRARTSGRRWRRPAGRRRGRRASRSAPRSAAGSCAEA